MKDKKKHLVRKVKQNCKTAPFLQPFRTALFRATTYKSKSWSSFAFIFMSLFFDENNIHLVDFHDKDLNDIHIWLFQTRRHGSLYPLTLHLRFDKATSGKVAYKSGLDNFSMLSPEYFCPNHQRYARKITLITRGAFLFFTRLSKYSKTRKNARHYIYKTSKISLTLNVF